jgi:hypothetical protein
MWGGILEPGFQYSLYPRNCVKYSNKITFYELIPNSSLPHRSVSYIASKPNFLRGFSGSQRGSSPASLWGAAFVGADMPDVFHYSYGNWFLTCAYEL